MPVDPHTPEATADRRQWAITMAYHFAVNGPQMGAALEETTMSGLRHVGADGLILGLTDLAAHLMTVVAEHSELTLEELALAIRKNVTP